MPPTGKLSAAEIAALKKKYPDVMFIVDAVSSLTALRGNRRVTWPP